MYYYWNDVTHPIMAVIIFLDFFQKFHDSILCRFGSLSLSSSHQSRFYTHHQNEGQKIVHLLLSFIWLLGPANVSVSFSLIHFPRSFFFYFDLTKPQGAGDYFPLIYLFLFFKMGSNFKRGVTHL